MLTIITTIDQKHNIQNAIHSIDHLDELVFVSHSEDSIPKNHKILYVVNGEINLPIDWFDNSPPIVFNNIEYSDANLLSLVFLALGNDQNAFEFSKQDAQLNNSVLAFINLKYGYQFEREFVQTFSEDYSILSLIQHYGQLSDRLSYPELKQLYQKGILNEDNPEIEANLAKHLSILLLDNGEIGKADEIINKIDSTHLSEEAQIAVKIQQALIAQQSLTRPYENTQLQFILQNLTDCIEFLEQKELFVNAGLLLIEASEISNYNEEYIGAKNFINKAISYFKEEEIIQFLGEASLRKAILLYTWSKNGQPQYYKPAINAFQDTLKVFKRGEFPQKFAEVHHYLALIYSEIPVSSDEKPMWAAFSASSFKEALDFFTKESYPYEFSMIAHNYATALIDFPEAKIHNNYTKAFKLFEESLEIRDAKQYPFERLSTLLNQLELYWLLPQESVEEETIRVGEMEAKIDEARLLAVDESMRERIAFHDEKLNTLKSI